MTHERHAAADVWPMGAHPVQDELGGPEHDHALPDARSVPVVASSYELYGDGGFVPIDPPDDSTAAPADLTVPDAVDDPTWHEISPL